MSDTAGSVLIVGAGIVGVACAHYLARAGHRVTVIDQGRIGGGSSHANCGHVCFSHVLPLTEPGSLRAGLASLLHPDAPFRIRPPLRPHTLWWLLRFATRCTRRWMHEAARHQQTLLNSSRVEYAQMFTAGEVDAQWRRSGLLYVLRSARGMDRFAAQDAMLRAEYGVGARRIEGDALPRFDAALRPGLAGGFHYEGDVSLRPDVLMAGWTRHLAARGARFEGNCRLRSVRIARGRIAGIATERGELRADEYVFAAGAWSRQLAAELGCRIPVEPGKGYSITTSAPRIAPRHPMLFAEHGVGVTPFEDGYRLGSIMEFAGYDTSIPAPRLRQLAESARHYLHDPIGGAVQERWFGWRPMTWDSLPIIGPVPGLGNATLATGHHMLGLTMAPATGRLVAELMRGETPHIDPAPFSAARFQ